MPYTPYAHLSDSELILAVANKEDPTDFELELMKRLVQFREDVLSTCEQVGEKGGFSADEAVEGVVARAAA